MDFRILGPVEVLRDGQPLGSRCRFPRDFDARVDFELLRWPPGNGITVALWECLPSNGGYQVARKSHRDWGEQYTTWMPPSYGGSVSIDDQRGTLRIARAGGVLTTSIRRGAEWAKLDARRVLGSLNVAPGASATGDDFAGKEVLVAFDNFVATAKELDCPAGAWPPERD